MEEQSLTIERYGERREVRISRSYLNTIIDVYSPGKILGVPRIVWYIAVIWLVLLYFGTFMSTLFLGSQALKQYQQGIHCCTNIEIALFCVAGIHLFMMCGIVDACQKTTNNGRGYIAMLVIGCFALIPGLILSIPLCCCLSTLEYLPQFWPRRYRIHETLTISSTLVNEAEKDEENYRGTDIEEGPRGDATASYQQAVSNPYV